MNETDTINGRTPEEIKKGLECCIEGKCSKCPYMHECDDHLAEGGDMLPADVVLTDMLSLIQQLEHERDEARKEATARRAANTVLRDVLDTVKLERDQMKRERDAAVECLSGVCDYCKHGCKMNDFCVECCTHDYCNWEWRGVQNDG